MACGGIIAGEAAATPPVEVDQLFQTRCADGSEAWIDVDGTLMARPSLREGTFTGYGEVESGP